MPPGCFQRRAFVRITDMCAKLAAVAQSLLDLRTKVGVVDDEFGDACAYQPLDMPHDERLAACLQQGLGRVVGERAHAFAAAGGQNHRAHLKPLFTFAPSPARGRPWLYSR